MANVDCPIQVVGVEYNDGAGASHLSTREEQHNTNTIPKHGNVVHEPQRVNDIDLLINFNSFDISDDDRETSSGPVDQVAMGNRVVIANEPGDHVSIDVGDSSGVRHNHPPLAMGSSFSCYCEDFDHDCKELVGGDAKSTYVAVNESKPEKTAEETRPVVGSEKEGSDEDGVDDEESDGDVGDESDECSESDDEDESESEGTDAEDEDVKAEEHALALKEAEALKQAEQVKQDVIERNPADDTIAVDILLDTNPNAAAHSIPHPVVSLKDVHSVEGEHIKFKAQFGGGGLNYSWLKDEVELLESPHTLVIDEHGCSYLEILSTNNSDEAEYTCVAVNSLGRCETSAQLLVDEASIARTKALAQQITDREEIDRQYWDERGMVRRHSATLNVISLIDNARASATDDPPSPPPQQHTVAPPTPQLQPPPPEKVAPIPPKMSPVQLELRSTIQPRGVEIDGLGRPGKIELTPSSQKQTLASLGQKDAMSPPCARTVESGHDEFIQDAGLCRLGASQHMSKSERDIENRLGQSRRPYAPRADVTVLDLITSSQSTTVSSQPSLSPKPPQAQRIIPSSTEVVDDDDFIEAAGLCRLDSSRRKSKAEKELEHQYGLSNGSTGAFNGRGDDSNELLNMISAADQSRRKSLSQAGSVSSPKSPRRAIEKFNDDDSQAAGLCDSHTTGLTLEGKDRRSRKEKELEMGLRTAIDNDADISPSSGRSYSFSFNQTRYSRPVMQAVQEEQQDKRKRLEEQKCDEVPQSHVKPAINGALTQVNEAVLQTHPTAVSESQISPKPIVNEVPNPVKSAVNEAPRSSVKPALDKPKTFPAKLTSPTTKLELKKFSIDPIMQTKTPIEKPVITAKTTTTIEKPVVVEKVNSRAPVVEDDFISPVEVSAVESTPQELTPCNGLDESASEQLVGFQRTSDSNDELANNLAKRVVDGAVREFMQPIESESERKDVPAAVKSQPRGNTLPAELPPASASEGCVERPANLKTRRKSHSDKMREIQQGYVNNPGPLYTGSSKELLTLVKKQSRAPLPPLCEGESLLTADGMAMRNSALGLPDDSFVEDAGLMRSDKSYQRSMSEILLEEQLNTAPTDVRRNEQVRDKDSFVVVEPDRKSSGGHTTEPLLLVEETINKQGECEIQITPRRGSVYEKKQVEAPVVVTGSKISSRTQSLFQQYEKDMNASLVRARQRSSSSGSSGSGCGRKASWLADEAGLTLGEANLQQTQDDKQKELEEVSRTYANTLEREASIEEPHCSITTASGDVKARKPMKNLINRYKATCEGDKKYSDDEEDADVEDKSPEKIVNGMTVIKSDREYKPADVKAPVQGVGEIKSSLHQHSGEWRPTAATSVVEEVIPIHERKSSLAQHSGEYNKPEMADGELDTQAISEARKTIKTIEYDQATDAERRASMSRNRPTSRRVTDPTELMEARKKRTYAADEIVQDGQVRKTVDIEAEFTSSSTKESIGFYKQLEETAKEVPVVTSRRSSRHSSRASSISSRHSDQDDVILATPTSKLSIRATSTSVVTSGSTEDVSGYVSGEGAMTTSPAASDGSDAYSSGILDDDINDDC